MVNVRTRLLLKNYHCQKTNSFHCLWQIRVILKLPNKFLILMHKEIRKEFPLCIFSQQVRTVLDQEVC